MKDTRPKALAGKLVLNWRAHGDTYGATPNSDLRDAIAALIRRERAACARLARNDRFSGGDEIADAILIRNKPPKAKR